MTWQIGDTLSTWADRNDLVHTDGTFFPGIIGQDFTMPDQAAFAPTTSLSIRVALTANDYTPAASQTLAAQALTSLTDRCWNFNLTTNNRLSLTLSTTGTVATAYSATASSVADVDRSTRTCFRADWTASPAEIKFWQKPYISPEDMALDTDWIQLGATVTTGPTTALFNSSARIRLGSFAGDSNLYTGLIHAAQIRVNGAVVASPRFDQGRSSAIFDEQGNQWTRDGVAQTVSPIFTGTVTVPVVTAPNQAAQVTAYDAVTGRLAIGGVEMGNTGWRTLVSWDAAGAYTYNAEGSLAADFAPLVGTAGWIRVIRKGGYASLMFLGIQTASIINGATSYTIFNAFPSAFTPYIASGSHVGVIDGGTFVFRVGSPALALRQQTGQGVASGTPIAGVSAITLTYPCAITWPTSLQGQLLTAPFTG